jgi:alkylation response protein AidB-like acyl-CoA dehydrogenase
MDKQVYIESDDIIITDRYVRKPGDQLTREQVAKLTPRDVIDRLKELKPFFASQARENEKRGRPSDECWFKVLNSGYMYLSIHKRFGGLQGTFEEMIEATDVLAEADPSLAWVAMFVVNTPRQLGAFPLPVQQLIYKDNAAPLVTNCVSPTGTAKKVKGGYLVSGRYAWCTTIQFTDWVQMFAQVEDDEGKRGPMQAFLARADQTKILRTWDAHGMIGTGTHHVVAEDVFVPDEHVTNPNDLQFAWGQADPAVFPDYPIMYVAAAPFGAAAISAVVAAAANGAVEQTQARLKNYNKRGSVVPEREKMSQQMRLARASVLATAAMLLVKKAAHVCETDCIQENVQQRDAYHQTQAWCAEAMEISRQVVSICMQSAGTSVHYLSSPIGRAFRDVFTGSSHASVDYDPLMTKWGQKMLDLNPEERIVLTERNKMRNEIDATKRANFERTTTDYNERRAI